MSPYVGINGTNGVNGDRRNETISHSDDDIENSTSNGVSGSTPESDPICLVGMACRLPGDIRSPLDLWNMLIQKRSAQGPVPPTRFNMEAFYHPDGNRAGVMNADGGYFLNEDVRLFENEFFGINAMEATYMDPQQRKLLEVVYECFESVGLSMDDVSGANIGVYVGNFTVDYQTMQTRDPDYMHRYNATGSGTAIMSNRISHVFNLHGPSMTLDTACSSSIYCLHSALLAIRNGDCESAIVAGANLITSPEPHLGTMKGGVLSPTSTCHTFDASADGYGRAEGVNAVYLQPLSAALREGNKIWAVFHGTAANSNGRTLGITQPSVKMQERVIRRAYDAAGLRFDDTDYIECHGTGTAVGDPIEVQALQACFAPRNKPLGIGSVKSNLGHSEAASGLTSLIKVAMAFEMGKIPPTYGVRELNPKLNLSRANMHVVTEVEDWPSLRRRASINSFGYGGANAHVVVESYDSYMGSSPALPEPKLCSPDTILSIPISAKSSNSLAARVQHTKKLLLDADPRGISSLTFTLTRKRPELHCRAVLLAKAHGANPVQLLDEDEDEITAAIGLGSKGLPFAFIFTGQGAQYPELGRRLLERNALFRRTIRELDEILRSLPSDTAPSWTIVHTLADSPDVSRVHDVTRSQPICTAVQIGLVDLLRIWGLDASAVVGHSSGEIAAAYAAGFLDAKEALLTAYFRGLAVGELQTEGGMVAAGVGPEEAGLLISKLGLEKELCVACVNSPVSVTFSGAERAAELLLEELKATKTFGKKLSTGRRAYHSNFVKQVGKMYEDLLRPYLEDSDLPRPSGAKMYSSVGYEAGQARLFPKQARNPRYWRDNLEKSVQFSGALHMLMKESHDGYHLIEIGPHFALKGATRQVCTAGQFDIQRFPYSATLMRGQDDELAMKRLVKYLYLHGHNLNWEFVNDIAPQDQVIRLGPTSYPWDYSAGLLWHESRLSIEMRNRKYPRHELLGSAQLGGNGIDWSWRNIFRLREAEWLSDHMIEGQVVFPATGYLGIAMEAISQVLEIPRNAHDVAFEFRNVTINTALIVQDENTSTGAKEAEIHTTMSPQKISNTQASGSWFQYTISSWMDGRSNLHCSGSVRLTTTNVSPRQNALAQSSQQLDKWTMGIWYKKLADEGFIFGPNFQSLTGLETDKNRTSTTAIAHTTLKTRVGTSTDTAYPVHPVTIDACLQAAIMGSTAGNIEDLKGFMPAFIKECRIQVLDPAARTDAAAIHTNTTTTGFCTKRINSTLIDTSGNVVVDMKDVRLSLHSGRMDQQETSRHLNGERHPTLRITWKPDILRLSLTSQKHVNKYISEFGKDLDGSNRAHRSCSAITTMIGAVLDLIGHNNPSFRSLFVTTGREDLSEYWLSLLKPDASLPRIRSWDTASFLEDNTLKLEDGAPKTFDAVVLDNKELSRRLWEHTPNEVLSLVGDWGIVVTAMTDTAVESLHNAQFTVINIGEQLVVGIKQGNTESRIQGKEAIIVHRTCSPEVETFSSSLSGYLKNIGAAEVTVISLADISTVAVSREMLCISLLELEHEFLATMSQDDMNLLRYLTDTVSDLLWITGANMLGNPDPNLTLSSGLSRSLMLEQPSLRFCVMDVGDLEKLDLISSFENIHKALTVFPHIDDKEFIQVDGTLYTSRFLPYDKINSLFRRRMKLENPVQNESLRTAGTGRLSISRPGVTDTLHFQQVRTTEATPSAGFVDVEMKAVSLNAKDVYNINGHVETKRGTSSLEFCGIVRSIGPGVGDLQVGDRVVVMAPNHFTTIERVPAWAAHKMLPGEEYSELCTLPVAYSTALYALNDRGHLRAGESILVHAGAGAFGTAAINVAKMIGATVYTTCSSPAKRRYLTEKLNIPAEHIFSSRDVSFAAGIRRVTEGRGVDLVVNSLVGDLMHASWDILANFGRFVEVGKRELTNVGKLQMDIFLKNTTFTAFDLSELFHHDNKYYRDIWALKTKETLDLYRAGVIKPGPIVRYDVSEISKAFRAFSAKDRIGKIVVSLEDNSSQIPVAPSKYGTVFNSEKIYILVGCLGGLGRSLSRWMLARGARHFAFIGRSADDKPSAQELIVHLKSNGANVTVIRGDVSVFDDVQAVVQACLETGKPIGGVVQAALGLNEDLFSRMSSEGWHAAVQPKWKGTWNLHHALAGHEDALDFFLLTSSVSGSVATATESNYCAANGFLDSWARWRRSQGKKATSIGLGMISEVGYLHENPEIESLLLRKGIQPLNEEEYLQAIDLALTSEGKLDPDGAHILTGLESQALHKLAEQGWDVSSGNLLDPRSGVLSASLISMMDKGNSRTTDVEFTDSPHWAQGISPVVTKALASEFHSTSLVDAVVGLIRKRFSALILMPIDQIDIARSLTKFGVDSMIAAEFRTWIWGTFKVDITFLDLLSDQKTLEALAESIVQGLSN